MTDCKEPGREGEDEGDVLVNITALESEVTHGVKELIFRW